MRQKNKDIATLSRKELSIRKRQKRKLTIGAWLLLIPAVVALYLMVWRPTVLGMIWSFFKMKGYTPTEFIGLENYIKVVTNTEFATVMWNTVEYVFWSFVIGFVPPIAIAFMINEMVHFRSAFRILIYLPAILPGTVIMLLWGFIYDPSNVGMLNMILSKFGMDPYVWLNDPTFVIMLIVIEMTWAGFPGTMFLYYTSIQSISPDLYEAATIDGAGPWKRFWHVAVPQLSGLLLLNIIRQMIGVFQVMQEPMVLTGGGPNGASMSVSYQLYQQGIIQGRVGQSLATGTIVFVILVIATIFYFKLEKKVDESM